jgi:hypothetical protein
VVPRAQLDFGSVGLQSLEVARITAKQMLAIRMVYPLLSLLLFGVGSHSSIYARRNQETCQSTLFSSVFDWLVGLQLRQIHFFSLHNHFHSCCLISEFKEKTFSLKLDLYC